MIGDYVVKFGLPVWSKDLNPKVNDVSTHILVTTSSKMAEFLLQSVDLSLVLTTIF